MEYKIYITTKIVSKKTPAGSLMSSATTLAAAVLMHSQMNALHT